MAPDSLVIVASVTDEHGIYVAVDEFLGDFSAKCHDGGRLARVWRAFRLKRTPARPISHFPPEAPVLLTL